MHNVTRPSIGDGWVNHHFINDGQVANQIPPGEPTCDGSVPGASADGLSGGSPGTGNGTGPDQTKPMVDGGALYYSPYDLRRGKDQILYNRRDWIENRVYAGKRISVKPPAQVVVLRTPWNGPARGKCRPLELPVKPESSDKRITTVAAWSASHNVPFALFERSKELREQINYILLFDPANAEQYRDAECSTSATARKQLTAWLDKSKDNRLVILAGEVTATRHGPRGAYAYYGIRHYLLDAVSEFKNQPRRNIRSQVIMCKYPSVNHEDIWIRFKGWMNKARITVDTCPTAAGIPQPDGWTPPPPAR